VVNIPVEHEHPLGAAGLEGVRGGHGDAVEQAEAHRAGPLRVVAGRAEGAEREPGLPAEQRLRRPGGSTGGVERRLPRALGGERVRVDHPAALHAERLHRVQVVELVDPQELLAPRGGRRDPLQAEPAASLELRLDRAQAARVLGVGACVVLVGAWMVDVEPHAARIRYPAP
jgi:hypothetical protein